MLSISHETVKIITDISSTATSVKRLALVSWNGDEPKLDLRMWHDKNGELKPGRGMTLRRPEAAALADALRSFLDGEDSKLLAR